MTEIILVTKRHDYISEVVSQSKDKFMQGILDVYMLAKANTDLRKYVLLEFQKELAKIAQWNDDKLRLEQARFADHDKMKHHIQSIYETNSIIYEGEHKIVRDNADVIREFVRQTYLQIARELWKKPNIMLEIAEKRQVSKNMEYLEKIIVQSIKSTLRRGHRHLDMKLVNDIREHVLDIETHDASYLRDVDDEHCKNEYFGDNNDNNSDYSEQLAESNGDRKSVEYANYNDNDEENNNEKNNNDANINANEIVLSCKQEIENDPEQNIDTLLFNQKSLSRAASLDMKRSDSMSSVKSSLKSYAKSESASEPSSKASSTAVRRSKPAHNKKLNIRANNALVKYDKYYLHKSKPLVRKIK